MIRLGILPSIRVDLGAKPPAGSEGERGTHGLDGLGERLAEYRETGARFSEWRAVAAMTDIRRSVFCIAANAPELDRHGALCEKQGLLPSVEPEVLMDGARSPEPCKEVTVGVLHAMFDASSEPPVQLEARLLEQNTVVEGKDCPQQASVEQTADATLLCLRRHVVPAIPGAVFLSAGPNDVVATRHVHAINAAQRPKPWRLGFSNGRASQDAARAARAGEPVNVAVAQQAFYHRSRDNGSVGPGGVHRTGGGAGRPSNADQPRRGMGR